MNIILFGILFFIFLVIVVQIGNWWYSLPANGHRRKNDL
jgi:hypothetical protein